MLIDGKPCDGVPILAAGAHRLAAAKSLGWSHIDCIEVDDDPVTAELWELAENLHRHDLTKDQRDEHIRRYAELLVERAKVAQPATLSQPVTGRGNKGIARQVADATGLSKDTIRRALNPKPPKPQLVDVVDAYDAVAAQADAIVRCALNT